MARISECGQNPKNSSVTQKFGDSDRKQDIANGSEPPRATKTPKNSSVTHLVRFKLVSRGSDGLRDEPPTWQLERRDGERDRGVGLEGQALEGREERDRIAGPACCHRGADCVQHHGCGVWETKICGLRFLKFRTVSHAVARCKAWWLSWVFQR